MKNYNKKAWEILNEDEKLALSLRLGHGKSTWEAGEIMEKAHYKFLEIEARAKQFLQLFSEHINLYEEVIPSYIRLEPRFREYLEGVIVRREKIHNTLEIIDNVEFTITSYREEIIVKEMKKLLGSKTVVNKNFALMIFEFDRWNNFRVLPKSIQEPSAFKRRNKNNDKINIRNILRMNTLTVEQIVKRYSYISRTKKTSKLLYVPIFSKYIPREDSIIEVEYDQDYVRELSQVGLYLFTRRERAEQFSELLYQYDFDRPKTCIDGQQFWPRFRLIVRHSLNYNNIRKRIASRKFLQTALRDLDINYLNPKNKDPNKPKRKRKKNKELGI